MKPDEQIQAAGQMADREPSHKELLDMLAAAHQAVAAAHRFVHEKRPRLDGSGFTLEIVAWRAYKSGHWAFAPYAAEKAEAARRAGWEPLFRRPEA